jgi:HlyD family secretion protein
MRGKWMLFAGVTILAAVAAGALSLWRSDLKVRKSAPPKAAAPQNSESVLDLSGRVQAQQVVSIPAPIDGTIEQFFIDVGHDVYEGELLARITNTELDASLEAATAELEKVRERVNAAQAEITAARLEASRAGADESRSRSEFERAEKAYLRQQMLIREGATPRLVFERSQREYETAKADYEIKQAAARAAQSRVDELNRNLDVYQRMLADRSASLEQANADIAAGEVRSPVDGMVVGRRGQAGQPVDRSVEDLLQIAVALTAMQVVIEPQPPVLARIRPGQAASIIMAEAPNGAIAGSVREVRGGQVIIDFVSPTPAIRPGLTAQVRIKLT